MLRPGELHGEAVFGVPDDAAGTLPIVRAAPIAGRRCSTAPHRQRQVDDAAPRWMPLSGRVSLAIGLRGTRRS